MNMESCVRTKGNMTSFQWNHRSTTRPQVCVSGSVRGAAACFTATGELLLAVLYAEKTLKRAWRPLALFREVVSY